MNHFSSLVSQLSVTTITLWIYMSLVYIVAIGKSRNDLADVAWGPGFMVAALAAFSYSAQPSSPLFLQPFSQISKPSGLIFLLLSLWALRLAIYIFRRNRNQGEDFRYRKWREEWGKTLYWRAYLQIFMLQGFFLFVIGLPIWGMPIWDPAPLLPSESRFHLVLGTLVWLAGFLCESIADFQMASFKKTKKDPQAILDSGLWRYSRHPNYFGEILVHWGLYWVCVAQGTPLWTAVGPLTLTVLLVKVSGVPMLEKKYDRHPAYQRYQRETSALIPWFKKTSQKAEPKRLR